jgi:HAD superfamily hydrolase (TIGR01509 family)
MTITTIFFDLDGVIIDTKLVHFEAFNKALGPYAITKEEHLSKYDGLKTRQKLHLLTSDKHLPLELHQEIWEKKQEYTTDYLKTYLFPDEAWRDLLTRLRRDGYRIGCCTNSIRKTALLVLGKMEIIEYFDTILSNDDVRNSKPHPEIYWNAMTSVDALPEETLIIEDSPYGLISAARSNAHVLRVSGPSEVTYDNITSKIRQVESVGTRLPKWSNRKMNVLIPMAGAGSRFEKVGYKLPKPLIDVRGKPMIQVVVENLNMDAHFIYVVQASHRRSFNLDIFLNAITPKCTIVEVDGITEGAACTVLLAKEYIDSENPLFLANSDQYVKWDPMAFMYNMQETKADAGIAVFEDTHPKWSFAKTDAHGFVTEVAEKKPISNMATVGYYYWKRGCDFVRYASQMIEKDIRVNNEFYVCPVFNEAISDGRKIRTFHVDEMWGLGTPEDLDRFLEKNRDYSN